MTANVQKGLKSSLTGGYAWTGDFMRLDNPVTTTFKDAWTSYVRVNYSY